MGITHFRPDKSDFNQQLPFIMSIFLITLLVLIFQPASAGEQLSRAQMAIEKRDKNKDGKIGRNEWKKNPATFERIDTDFDGFLTLEELDVRMAEKSGSSGMKSSQTPDKTGSISKQASNQLSPAQPDTRSVASKPKMNFSKQKTKNSTLTGRLFHMGQSRIIRASNQMSVVLKTMLNREIPLTTVIDDVSKGRGSRYLFNLFLIAGGLILLGLFAEWMGMRFTHGIRDSLLKNVPHSQLQKFSRIASSILLDIIGLGIFIAVTFISFSMIFSLGKQGYNLVSIALIATYNFRLIRLVVRVVLSPSTKGLRLVPMNDSDVEYLHKWILFISGVAVFIAAMSRILSRIQVLQKELIFMATYAMSGMSIIVLIIVMIWFSRQRIAKAITFDNPDQSDDFQARIADTWHLFATLYVCVIGVFWEINLFGGNRVSIFRLIGSLLFIPLFLAVDQWVQKILKIASGEDTSFIDVTEKEQPNSFVRHYAQVIRKSLRVVLFISFIFLTLRLWGIDLAIGRYVTSHLIGIAMALLLGFATWEFAKARIDKKIKEEIPDMEDMEEGGAGGSRIGTLLMLLRKCILAILIIIISMIILSGLGIDIGPLIASAGIIGLAIGFGAQKLVQDILSGLFFLVDDAFRLNDYIEAGGTKGMVEHISLRSLKLRHPRGMLHTIPYGSMGLLTNFSRDYIITKLDIRVKYDTDVDKVRKIIKKIYKTLKKDEQINPVLLGKIKSQGVRQMDDSAMIMRVKFKTIPGEQFIVRREVYRMIQEKFRENNIEFAHRNVTVYMPGDNHTTPEARTAAAAAASAASEQDPGIQGEKKPE